MVRTSVRSRTHILNCCDINLYQIAKYRYLFKKTLGLLPNCFRDMFNFASQIHSPNTRNRPLALRGHVTIASFKQRVGILLMPKIDRAHKNCLAPAVWKETHLREIFYGTLIFQQRSMICIGRHVGGHTLALQHGGQNYFLLLPC